MKPDEEAVERALTAVLGAEVGLAVEFEQALDARDMARAKELLDLVGDDAIQIQLMRAILDRWRGANADGD